MSLVDFNVEAGILQSAFLRHLEGVDLVAKDRAPPAPVDVGDDVTSKGFEWSDVLVELACLVRRTSPLPAWTHKSRVC